MIKSKLELLEMLGDPDNKGKLVSLGNKEIDNKLYCMYKLNNDIFCIRL